LIPCEPATPRDVGHAVVVGTQIDGSAPAARARTTVASHIWSASGAPIQLRLMTRQRVPTAHCPRTASCARPIN